MKKTAGHELDDFDCIARLSWKRSSVCRFIFEKQLRL